MQYISIYSPAIIFCKLQLLYLKKQPLFCYFQILPIHSIYTENWGCRLSNAMVSHFITSTEIKSNKCDINKAVQRLRKITYSKMLKKKKNPGKFGYKNWNIRSVITQCWYLYHQVRPLCIFCHIICLYDRKVFAFL